MFDVRTTETFDAWLNGLKDSTAKARINVRIRRVQLGNLGDVKFFSGIGELRLTFGAGYRVYFVQRGGVLIILLCGGDKSTQTKDIEAALKLAKEIQDDPKNNAV